MVSNSKTPLFVENDMKSKVSTKQRVGWERSQRKRSSMCKGQWSVGDDKGSKEPR